MEGISFNWVSEPKEPLNFEIGMKYYLSNKRLIELGQRKWIFKSILNFALDKALSDVLGAADQILRVVVGDKNYLYKFEEYYQHWKQISFCDNSIKVIMLS